MDNKMSIEKILSDVVPNKSKQAYDKTWSDFELFRRSSDTKNENKDETNQQINDEPGEEDYMQYFYYLHKEKKFKSSSLWCMYSRLNNNHQRRFGQKLQRWPRITMLLKKYEAGYVRKVAKISGTLNLFKN